MSTVTRVHSFMRSFAIRATRYGVGILGSILLLTSCGDGGANSPIPAGGEVGSPPAAINEGTRGEWKGSVELTTEADGVGSLAVAQEQAEPLQGNLLVEETRNQREDTSQGVTQ